MAKNWKNLGQATMCATFLSGALLVTVPANAQGALGGTGDAAIPNRVAADQPAPEKPMIDLQFENVAVVDLLKVIAKSFNVNVLINDDVSGSLSYVNITGKTPDEALQYVARAARLKIRREADGTYQIGKTLLDDETVTPVVAAPAGIVPNNQIFGGGIAGLPVDGALGNFGVETPTGITNRPAANKYAIGDFELPNLVETRAQSSQRNSGPTPIRVRNVRPGVMAYWLDPVNNPVPIEFLQHEVAKQNYNPNRPIARAALSPEDQASINGNGRVNPLMGADYGGVAPSPYVNPYTRASSSLSPEVRSNFQFGGFGGNQNVGGQGGRNQAGGGQNNRQGGGGQGGGGTFELPGEIEQIIAIDAQNVLMVAGGTPEDIAKLREIINVLDRPLRQVEIEAQFVTVSTSDSRQLGIDFSTARGNFNANTNGFSPGDGAGTFQVGFVRGNFQAQLTALERQDRAKILTAPRVTAINNLTAMIQSQESRPIVLNVIGNNGGALGGGNQIQAQNLIYITTSIGLQVTPTINGDDTITVLMQPQLQSQTPLAAAEGAPLITSQMVQTVANVRDGDTIALGGLKTKTITRGGARVPLLSDIPLIGKLFRQKLDNDNESELIIFVTARIVRRAGDDDEVVPGT